MAEENRRRVVGNALRPLLEEGEAFNVYCHEGEILVNEAETSVCAARHPRLYGRLLALNAELEQAGAGVGRLPVLLVLTFCVGLHLQWWGAWLGDLRERFDSFWFYALVAYAVYQVLSFVARALERRAYQRGRDELLALLGPEDLDRDALLAMIEGDGAVGRVGHHLKLDRDAARPSGAG